MKPNRVEKGDWIRVGINGIDGFVRYVFSDTELNVGYYQNKHKAIGEDVVWNEKDGRWDFKYDGPNGSYLHGQEERIVKEGPR